MFVVIVVVNIICIVIIIIVVDKHKLTLERLRWEIRS